MQSDDLMATSNIIDDIDVDPPEVNEEDRIMNNIEKLEGKIKELQVESIRASEKGDPETLSVNLMRLAHVNSALGKNAAYATYIARNADRAYRRAREQAKLNYINDKMTIGKAESQAYIDVDSMVNIYSEAQLVADQASDLCFRTDTFLKLSQSRLSLIKNDALRS